LRVLGTLVTASGATALLAEQVFERVLSTVVGASTPASAIVLAVYFLGLTLGGALYAAAAPHPRRPVMLYGAIEGCIALWALGLSLLFSPIQRLSGSLMHLAGESGAAVFGMRALVSSALILPPTIAMGLTFPAVVAALDRFAASRPQRLLARFYALNLLGAVAGAASGPYLVFPALGMTGTLLVAAGVGAAILGTTLALGRWWPTAGSLPMAAISQTTPPAAAFRTLVGGTSGRLLLVAAFVSGFIAFGFEVVWVHLVGAVLGNSVYAFGLMLAAVLGGLWVGSVVTSRMRSTTNTVPAWLVPVAMLSAAAVLSATLSAWPRVPAFLGRWGAGATTFVEGELLRLVVLIALVTIPAAFTGTVFPILLRTPWLPLERRDAATGLLGAVNAVGSILGALLTGFMILPVLGSEAAFRTLVLLLVPCALALGLIEARSDRRIPGRGSTRRTGAALGAMAGIVCAGVWAQPAWNHLALTSGVNVYFTPLHVTAESRLLFFHEDTSGGFTTVVRNPISQTGETTRVLLTNGKFQGNDTGEMAAQIAFALVPILHSTARERALVIGLGTGHSAHIVEGAGYRHVDIAEIAPGVVAASNEWFRHVNREVLGRGNVALHLEDGRNFLLRTNERYDLITMEISSIWFAGSTNLYSEEFYRLARSRLREDGIFQQWIQFHHIDPREVTSVVMTLRKVFPHVSVWYLGGQGILVASPAPLQLQRPSLDLVVAASGLANDLKALARLGRLAPPDLPRFRVLDAAAVTRLTLRATALGIPVNTDRNRFLEYSTPTHNLDRWPREPEVLKFLVKLARP
jgi:spermidine synthase